MQPDQRSLKQNRSVNRVATANLRILVRKAVRSADLDWSHLRKSAKQIILFGSYACGTHTSESDVDLLCVGHGRRLKRRALHLLWVDESTLRDPKWLGSELAWHVSRCGIWLKGANDWARLAIPSTEAVQRKRKRILTRAEGLDTDAS